MIAQHLVFVPITVIGAVFVAVVSTMIAIEFKERRRAARVSRKPRLQIVSSNALTFRHMKSESPGRGASSEPERVTRRFNVVPQ